jgi:hypothetical protein
MYLYQTEVIENRMGIAGAVLAAPLTHTGHSASSASLTRPFPVVSTDQTELGPPLAGR